MENKCIKSVSELDIVAVVCIRIRLCVISCLVGNAIYYIAFVLVNEINFLDVHCSDDSVMAALPSAKQFFGVEIISAMVWLVCNAYAMVIVPTSWAIRFA